MSLCITLFISLFFHSILPSLLSSSLIFSLCLAEMAGGVFRVLVAFCFAPCYSVFRLAKKDLSAVEASFTELGICQQQHPCRTPCQTCKDLRNKSFSFAALYVKHCLKLCTQSSSRLWCSSSSVLHMLSMYREETDQSCRNCYRAQCFETARLPLVSQYFAIAMSIHVFDIFWIIMTYCETETRTTQLCCLGRRMTQTPVGQLVTKAYKSHQKPIFCVNKGVSKTKEK